MPNADLLKIIELARLYEVSKVFLFGSMQTNPSTAKDVDLGIVGASGLNYLRLAFDLNVSLSKPVDVVNLEENDFFSQLVQRDGELLYV